MQKKVKPWKLQIASVNLQIYLANIQDQFEKLELTK